MQTIANGIILKGLDLKPSKENILIDNGEIIEISPKVLEGEIIDASDSYVVPSFLNAHTHIGDSIIKDCGDGKTIDEIVKPPNGLKHRVLSNSSDDELIESMKSSMMDMLSSGTTHFIDYREGGIEGIKLLKKASKDIPINPIILGRDDIFYDNQADPSKVRKKIKSILKIADGIAPSGFGEISDETAKIIVDECRKASKISSIHVGEYESLQKDSLLKFKKTEIEKGVDFNFNLLIHLTYPMNNDLDKVFKNSKITSISLCPRSNGVLSLGIVPLNVIIEKRIKPLLGTDNIMFNSPNMMNEMEYALKAVRANYGTYINPKDILQMATTNIVSNSINSINSINSFNSINNKNISDNKLENQESVNEDNDNNIFNLNSIVKKSIIDIKNSPQLVIVKKHSNNPYLNIINRVETKDIKYVFNGENYIDFT
ncbi:MAG: amidohydrolase family protein [Methanobrevibacter sp.]|nr:amidohydrolase family protein [Candidatus Methanoflexus mossambicus]